MNMLPAGYSGTPLAKKLGLTPGCKVLLIDAPIELDAWLAPLPENLQFMHAPDTRIDVALVFAIWQSDLATQLQALRDELRADASVWICWPKRAARVSTYVTEDVIRKLALPLGWVDIKVCAISAVFSGLKLVVRKHLR